MANTMNELMVWLWQWRYQTEDGINFTVRVDKNCSWQLWQCPGGKMDSLGLNLEPTVHQDTFGKLSSRAF